MFFIIEEAKEATLDFPEGTVGYCNFILLYYNIKLKPAIKENGTEVTLNLSSNVIGASNDETSFLHKSLFTDTSFEAS